MNIIIILLTIILLISIIIHKMNIEFIRIDSTEEKSQPLKKKTCNCGKKSKRIN